jgi:hypothetical protein
MATMAISNDDANAWHGRESYHNKYDRIMNGGNLSPPMLPYPVEIGRRKSFIASQQS